jgi:hypothetical protein
VDGIQVKMKALINFLRNALEGWRKLLFPTQAEQEASTTKRLAALDAKIKEEEKKAKLRELRQRGKPKPTQKRQPQIMDNMLDFGGHPNRNTNRPQKQVPDFLKF